ncbi:hypothetical protein DMI70_18270 [Escherichia coli]|nr:hypothetical protein [Escherichia coli]
MGRMNIYFNRGYYEYGRGYKKGADPVFKAGLEFKLDVAHETGHMILKVTVGIRIHGSIKGPLILYHLNMHCLIQFIRDWRDRFNEIL